MCGAQQRLAAKSSHQAPFSAEVGARRDIGTIPALVRVGMHYRPSITHSLLIHLLTLIHTHSHTQDTYMQADAPSNTST